MRTIRVFVISISLIVFLYVGISTVISSFPQYDDAYNASVSKNIATGYGYASSYHGKRLFPAEVSTGPSLILPGALLIYLFGTRYWVPSFTTFIISFVLFIYIIKLLFEQVSNKKSSAEHATWDTNLFALSIFLFAFLLIPEIHSIAFIGEFPAALFFCAGTLTIFKRNNTKADLFIGGCLLGLSITTKVITLGLMLPVVVLWVFYHFIYEKEEEKKPKLFLIILGVILPSLLFEIFKLFTIGWNDFLILKQNEINFFSDYGSGITQTRHSTDLFTFIRTNFIRNLKVLYRTLHVRFSLIIFTLINLASFIIVLRKSFQRRNFSSLELMSTSLFFSAVPLILWWLGFNHIGWYRTISPVTTAIALNIIINVIILFKKPVSAGLIVLGISLIILLSQIPAWGYLSPPRIPRASIQATTNTIKYLESLQAEGKELLGCGWWWANRRLEYFMHSNENFYECLVSPLENSVLVIDREYWNWGSREDIRLIEDKCPTIIFKDAPFQVNQCSD